MFPKGLPQRIRKAGDASSNTHTTDTTSPAVPFEFNRHLGNVSNERGSVTAESTDDGLQFQDSLENLGPLQVTPTAFASSTSHAYSETVPVAHTLLSLGQSSSRFAPASTQDAPRTSSHQQHQDTPSPRHIDALPMPSEQKRLIHHWITFTSRKLVLLDEPHNQCRTMMLPMALKGLNSKSGDSNADVAIFHAICASSAYNLYELGGRKDEAKHVLALRHDQQAIHHLRHDLRSVHAHRDQSSAMAIMACIAVEAVSGTTQRWRMHVSGGLAYLMSLQTQGLPEAIVSTFRQHIVKMAILCGVPVPKEMKLFLEDKDLTTEPLELTFPYYGVSTSFLRALDRINTFAAPNSLAPTNEKDLDAFELQLYLDFPSLPNPIPVPNRPPTSLSPIHTAVIANTSRAFYYAALIYFQRRIRHAAPADVQALVRLGVSELECIERAGGEDELGCIMLWPALVLGAECNAEVEQRRMLAWFQGQRRLGFRNVVVLEDLVKTVWDCRKRGADVVDWWEVTEEARFDIFRL